MQMFPIFLLIASGALMGAQATINSTLGRSVGLPLFTVVFSALQLFCAIPVLLIWGRPFRVADLIATPWWQHVGACLGVVILLGLASGFARAGAFMGLVSMLVGQLAMGMIIDHFGWFGAAVQPVSLSRLLGFGCVLLGLWLIKL